MASVRFTDVRARPTEFLDFTSRKVFHMCWTSQRARPNSYRFMKSPITRIVHLFRLGKAQRTTH